MLNDSLKITKLKVTRWGPQRWPLKSEPRTFPSHPSEGISQGGKGIASFLHGSILSASNRRGCINISGMSEFLFFFFLLAPQPKRRDLHFFCSVGMCQWGLPFFTYSPPPPVGVPAIATLISLVNLVSKGENSAKKNPCCVVPWPSDCLPLPGSSRLSNPEGSCASPISFPWI